MSAANVNYVWIGRYQPFHVGHREILSHSLIVLPGRQIIGISCSEAANHDVAVRTDEKFEESYCPFTAFERYELTRLSIHDLGGPGQIDILLLPRNDLAGARLRSFLPREYFRCCTNKDEDDIAKATRWRERGESTVILELGANQRPLTATEIRGRLLQGEDWRKFICRDAQEFFADIDGPGRLLRAAQQIEQRRLSVNES